MDRSGEEDLSKGSKRINKGEEESDTAKQKKKKSLKKTAEVNIPIFQSTFRKNTGKNNHNILCTNIYIFNGCSYWSGSH